MRWALTWLYTWRYLRRLRKSDPIGHRILTTKGHNPADYVDAPHPGSL